ncbi:hypothetical protein [Robertkochia flava]|uniref:hypothetical protein n=1 Tax=Robertkochia flava TaxID=3447986 RepID=UPI001CC9F032|nr:hypothetical protein [Robertkochia marina]
MSKLSKPVINLILGGVFFLIPILAGTFLIARAFRILNPISRRIAEQLNTSSVIKVILVELISVLILLLICYAAGWLLHKGIIRNWKGNIEERLFYLFPGLLRLKFSLLGDERSSPWEKNWHAGIFREDNFYRLGFISRHADPDFICVFIPDAPRMESGEIRYYPRKDFEYSPVSMKDFADAYKKFGRGLSAGEILNSKHNTQESG